MSKGKYIGIWVIAAVLLLIALSIDNMLWLSASPEWDTKFTVNRGGYYWVGPVKDYPTSALLDYLFFYRIVSVWTNLRDILAACIVGTLAVIFIILKDKRLMKKKQNQQSIQTQQNHSPQWGKGITTYN